MTSDHAQQALEFLRAHLGTKAPKSLGAGRFVPGQPLEGEGDMTVFPFQADLQGGQLERFWVVAGQTEANYYPHWSLTAEEAYCVHLGTRFMLVMEAAQVMEGEWPADLAARVREAAAGAFPGLEILSVTPLAVFRVEHQIHAVCHVKLGTAGVIVVAYDAPLGIYPASGQLPHVVYRKHLGSLIQSEAEREARHAQKLRGGRANS